VVPTPPPKAVRVIHSTAYMQQTQQLLVRACGVCLRVVGTSAV
jgi:hypothetical protein